MDLSTGEQRAGYIPNINGQECSLLSLLIPNRSLDREKTYCENTIFSLHIIFASLHTILLPDSYRHKPPCLRRSACNLVDR